jgi:hypothetical protein
MSTATIYSLAPITLNSTTLATANLRVSPDVASIMHRTSGNEFASVEAIVGGAPRVTFSTPYYEAYNLIGLKTLKCTAVSIYLAKFVDSVRSASAVHTKYALASSALGFAYIKAIRGSQGGIVMADVEVILLSSDGTTHPLVATTANALPSLASQPALRTLGPATINGTTVGGVKNVSVELGAAIEAMAGDGDLYPRVCAYKGGDPVIRVDHGDPETLRATLGFTGVALASNFVQYLRAIDTTTQLASATGDSLTVASGRVIPNDWGADNLAIADGSFRVECLSTSATHPIVVATGASVPTP